MTPTPHRQYLSSPPCGWACVFCFPEQISDPCENCNIRIPHKQHAIAKDIGRMAHEVLHDMYDQKDGFNEFVQHNYMCGQAHAKLVSPDGEGVFDNFFLGNSYFSNAYCFELKGDTCAKSFRAWTKPRRDCLNHTVNLDDAKKQYRLRSESKQIYETSTEKTFLDPLTSQERSTRMGERINKIARRNWWIKVAAGATVITLGCMLGILLIILI